MSINNYFKSFGCLIYLGLASCAWEQTEPAADCSISPLTLEVLELMGSDCAVPSGGFTIGVSGGEAPYSYSSDAITGSQGEFNSIAAGSYLVGVEDINGCTAEITVDVLNLDGVNLTEVNVVDAACGTTDGQIQIDANGGLEPYSYRLNEGQAQFSNTFSGLTSGKQVISVIDDEGCKVSKTVVLFSGVSFENSIQGIITDNCKSCHGVTASPSFDSYDEIKTHAETIKRVTGDRSMPVDATISQDEIDMIACWVDDGALSN